MITFPNAKINIGLNITEKRADGYHNLETIFYPIDLKEALEVVESDETEFCSSGLEIDGSAENNLIVKAYNLLNEEFDMPKVKIHLHKSIPMGAGLGGGSADAAFMLDMLNKMFDLGLTKKEMMERAAKLGADCPFFLMNKPVMAKGIGNVFEPTSIDLSGKYIVLVKPEIHVSTKEAYSACKPGRWERPLNEVVKLPIGEWKNLVVNDFEKSVFPIHPELGKIKELMYEKGALYAAMSGSGSTIYGIFDKETNEDEMADALKVILDKTGFALFQKLL